MRLPFMKSFNIEEFEFSQSYLFFWDKVRPVLLHHKPTAATASLYVRVPVVAAASTLCGGHICKVTVKRQLVV